MNTKPKHSSERINTIQDECLTAILIDGGFYRKRIKDLPGSHDANLSADELESYCKRHLNEKINGNLVNHQLYRIFYYDCPPIKKTVFNPITKSNSDLGKSGTFQWTEMFLNALKQKRKFALRLGKISETTINYQLRERALRELLSGKLKIEELKESDIYLDIKQKGVDMKIGLDIASLAYKKQVNQIVLISGDSDFVSAAKLARREGIDFILDPLGTTIKPDLFEHIDGLRTVDNKFKITKNK